MQKAHHNKNWQNKPSTKTPLNESNLNELDHSVDTIDDRVISLDTTKANQTDMLQTISNITFNRSTGIFTVTRYNGTSFTIDTDLEKIAINFDYDDDPTSAHYQQLILTLIDGTVKYIDMGALITQYEFVDSSTIHFTIGADGKVSATIIAGSITEVMLEPNFLADCRTEVAKATQQADLANGYRKRSEAYAVGTEYEIPVSSDDPAYENNSLYYSQRANAWANGEINGTPVPTTDETHQNNSRYYSDLAESYMESAEEYRDEAKDLVEAAEEIVSGVRFTVNFETGNLEYDNESTYNFTVNETTGNLEWEVVV